MKVRLGCQSVASVRWIVKKILAWTEMMCDKVRGHCNDIEILFSFRGAILGLMGPVVYIGPKA